MIYVNARAIIERIVEKNIEVIVQWRNKKGQECWEFPGGQVEQFESLFCALKREVKEETGLDVIEATVHDNYVQTDNNPDFIVECFRPYAVYQTVKGTFDSMGVYFKCSVTGEPLSLGDDSKNAKWINLDELRNLLNTKGLFSDVDRAAALFYLKEQAVFTIK